MDGRDSSPTVRESGLGDDLSHFHKKLMKVSIGNLIAKLQLTDHQPWMNANPFREQEYALFRIQRSNAHDEVIELCFRHEKFSSGVVRSHFLCREDFLALNLLRQLNINRNKAIPV